MKLNILKAFALAAFLALSPLTTHAEKQAQQQAPLAFNPFTIWPGMAPGTPQPYAMPGAIPSAPAAQPGTVNPFMPFMNPMNWTNPYTYGQFMYPGTYMAMMNPGTYMPFMNPMTYMPLMNPMAYMHFMNPAAYMQWMDPALYTQMMNQAMTQYGMAPQAGQTPQASTDWWANWMRMWQQPQQPADK